MTKYFRKEGKTLRAPAPAGGVVSGMGYIIGAAFGISPVTANAGESVDFWLEHCHQLPKAGGQAWDTLGALVYWDNTAKVATTTAGANAKIGIVDEVAAAGDARGTVRLNGAF